MRRFELGVAAVAVIAVLVALTVYSSPTHEKKADYNVVMFFRTTNSSTTGYTLVNKGNGWESSMTDGGFYLYNGELELRNLEGQQVVSGVATYATPDKTFRTLTWVASENGGEWNGGGTKYKYSLPPRTIFGLGNHRSARAWLTVQVRVFDSKYPLPALPIASDQAACDIRERNDCL